MNLTEIVNDLESQGSSANIALKLFNYPGGPVTGIPGDCAGCPIAKYIKKAMNHDAVHGDNTFVNNVIVGGGLIEVEKFIDLRKEESQIEMGKILEQFVIDFDTGVFPELNGF